MLSITSPIQQKLAGSSWFASFWRVNLASMFAFAGLLGAFHPAVSLYALELKATPLQLAIIFTLPRLLGIALRLPSGALSTHIGRKKLLIFGGVVCVLAPLLLSVSHSIPLLIFSCGLYGLTNLFGPVALSLVHDVVPKEKRLTYLGYYSTFSGLGSGLGPLMSGFLIDLWGSYIPVFYFCSFLGFLAFSMVVSLPSHSREKKNGEKAHVQMVRDLGSVSRQPEILFVSSCRGLLSLVVGTINAFFPWYGKGVAGLSASQIGMILAMLTFSSVLARALSRFHAEMKHRIGFMVLVTTLSGFFIFAISQFTHFYILLGITTMLGFGEGVFQIGSLSYVSEVAGKRFFGAAIGLLWATGDFGIVIGRFLPGLFLPLVPLATHYSQAFGWLGGGVACAGCLSPTILRFARKKA